MKSLISVMFVLILITSTCQRKDVMRQYEKPVTFTRDGKQIVGMMHFPKQTSPKYPAIILLHGFTGHKAESHYMFTRLARSFAREGFICLRFDFLGSGDSEGEFADMTILTELQDARSAVQFLLNQPEVDVNRIGLMGLSMGGCVAALLAGENSDIKSLVLWSAVAHPQTQFQGYLTALPKVSVSNKSWYIDDNGFAIGEQFFQSLDSIKPLETIASFKGPALIVHGSDDVVVPLSAAKDYFDVLNSRKQVTSELFVMEQADHVFSGVFLTSQLIEKTVNWFINTLQK